MSPKVVLKGNLHVHTTLSDGNMSPKSVIDCYRTLGYDFLAFTDHTLEPKPYEYPEAEGIIILNGCEVSSGEHRPFIRGEKETLTVLAHPMRYRNSIQSINRCGKDLCEVTEHGDFYLRTKPNSVEILERSRIPVVVSDDAHSLRQMGRTAVLVEIDEETIPSKDAIILALKLGKFSIWTKDMTS